MKKEIFIKMLKKQLYIIAMVVLVVLLTTNDRSVYYYAAAISNQTEQSSETEARSMDKDLENFIETPPASNIELSNFFNIIRGKDTYVSKNHPNTIQITGQTQNQLATMWSKQKIDLTKRARLASYVYIRGHEEAERNLGDGFTLTLHNDPEKLNAVGSAGQGLGVYPEYLNGETSPQVRNSLSFEFDTFLNQSKTVESCYDTNIFSMFYHVAFVYGNEIRKQCEGEQVHRQLHRMDTISGFSWDKWVKFQVNWIPNSENGGALSVLVGEERYTEEIPDIDKAFGLTSDDKSVYWGYTGSTGLRATTSGMSMESLPQVPALDVQNVLKDQNGASVEGKMSYVNPVKAHHTIKETTKNFPLREGKLQVKLGEALTFSGNAKMKYQNVESDVQWQQHDDMLEFTLPDAFVGESDVEVTYDLKPNTTALNKKSIFSAKVVNDLLKYKGTDVTVELVNGTPIITNTKPIVELPLGAVMPNVLDGIQATDTEDGDITAQIKTEGTIDTNVQGVYTITYSAADELGATTTSMRRYVVGAKNTGTKYAIFSEDSKQRVNNVDTSDQGIVSALKGYTINLTTNDRGTVKVVDKGGYVNRVGTYIVVLEATDEAGLQARSNIEVVLGQKPVVTNSQAIVKLPLGVSAPNLLDNITATDVEDGDITTNVVATGTVDTNAPGVYQITYNVTDSDNQVADPVQRVYVVGAKNTTDQYALFADDFTIRQNLVDINEAAIMSQANAYTVKLSDSTRGVATVTNRGGYSNVKGAYRIQFGSVNDPNLSASITATVITGAVPIITNSVPMIKLRLDESLPNVLDGVTANDAEDGDLTGQLSATGTVDTSKAGVYYITYNVTDSDGQKAESKGRAYVVDAKQTNDTYALFARDFTIRAGEVQQTGTQIIDRAQAYTINIKTKEKGEVRVVNNGGYSANTGVYTAKLAAVAAPELQHDITIDVVKGADPVLTDTTKEIVLKLNEATPDVRKNMTAFDQEDGDITTKITTTGAVDTTKRGKYVVTYQIVDSDGNQATAQRMYYVGAIVGSNYYILADDFMIAQADVAGNETELKTQILTKSQAKSYSKVDDRQRGTVAISNLNNYGNKTGVYHPEVQVLEETAVKGTIKAIVQTTATLEGQDFTIDLNELHTLQDPQLLERRIVALSQAKLRLADGTDATHIAQFQARIADPAAVSTSIKYTTGKYIVQLQVQVQDPDHLIANNTQIPGKQIAMTVVDSRGGSKDDQSVNQNKLVTTGEHQHIVEGLILLGIGIVSMLSYMYWYKRKQMVQ